MHPTFSLLAEPDALPVRWEADGTLAALLLAIAEGRVEPLGIQVDRARSVPARQGWYAGVHAATALTEQDTLTLRPPRTQRCGDRHKDVELLIVPGATTVRLLPVACQRRCQDNDGPVSARLATVGDMNGSATAASGLRTGPHRGRSRKIEHCR
ncbi:hypothetical protein ACIBQ1_59465 [Nonomuraea sp. NPDC050153]|uniref:hypothetical protein n=1 Tax=Nonomuraea sp. NPDC050153 TaxID=3364359 RepID=UPI00379AF8D1